MFSKNLIQVLELMSKILQFTEIEKEKVGLNKKATVGIFLIHIFL